MVVPTGSWLPYFYNDNRRTFFVLPVLAFGGCGFDMPAFAFSTEIRFRYPAVKGLFRAAETWIEGKIRLWLENHLALDSIGEDYRDGIERYLHAQFPDTHTPGYSDAELTDLIGRYLMRSVHRFLAQWSWGIHRFSKYRFHNYYHPFVCEFMKLVYNPLRGISALMSRETQLMDTGFDFARVYKPTELVIDHFLDSSRTSAYPKENVDFSADGAYACYNWELFYHAPLLIANALTRNQRFEEAREWYHYIFNPIGVEGPVQGKLKTSRYWITKPFFQTTDEKYRQQRIDSILRMLAGDATAPGYSESARNALAAQVKDWRDNPFEPHRIANYRTVAYQKTVVMKYLDNLIEWGDYLFRQDSMESINEATQLYVLAAEILGPRPRVIPPQAKPPVGSYNELEETFGAFSNALVQIENLVPALPASSDFSVENPPLPTLFFCLPHNENLLEYWDRVADRLYKIRHCMNIEGVTRQLALFEPPIDPAALVKAVAGGMDIGSALADLNAPLPYYRFHVLLQKANEVCNDVKSLGGALLAALEKKDAEALGRLRQAHEIQVLKAVTNVRERQIEEANENLDSLVASKELAKARREFYESREFMNSGETTARDLAVASTVLETSISAIYGLAGGLKAIPQFLLGAAGFGGAPYATAEIGGKTFGEISETAARMLSSISHVLEKNASLASTTASYERRKEDWDFQAKLAAKEITQIEEQIAAAELRVSIAEKELANHEIQIDNAEAMDEFMRSKYTNQELYQWQIGQISSVFFQSYKLAYDLAKRAERCLRFELGIEHTNYIQFGYWDSLRKGLLSGERLQLDLRKLDTAYQERNRRELELTKHVSFALLDPDALIALRETGRCFFTLPEELFDLDYPGHYFRRIKSVGLSLPCIAGPYTTVPCTLRLMKSSVRIKTSSTGAYGRNADEDGTWLDDDRFVESQVPLRAIATSSARDDSGVFELSFRDERYLPFEGAGAISEWCLELFSDSTDDFGRALRQFDYGTISDAVLHVRYTAREDAGPFKASALKHLREYMSERTTLNVRLLDLRREFPSQWHAFLHPAVPEGGTVFELPVTEKLFPWRDQGKVLTVGRLCALARVADDSTCRIEVVASQSLGQQNLASLKEYGGLHVATYEDPGLEIDTDSEADPTIWRIRMETDAGANISPDQVTDLFLILQYTAE